MSRKYLFEVIFMYSSIKIRAKSLLAGCNFRLFAAAFLSVSLRWGLAAAVTVGAFSVLKPHFSALLPPFTGLGADDILLFVGISLARFVLMLIISALRLGEQYIFFLRAAGKQPKTKYLFRFFTPEKALAAFRLYVKINLCRLGWLVLFMFPGSLVLTAGAFLYINGAGFGTLCALLAGCAALFSVGAFFFTGSLIRTGAAALFLFADPSAGTAAAIKKSTAVTDGAVYSCCILKATLAGWALLIFLPGGIFYSLPYIKLTNAVFAFETACAGLSAAHAAPASGKEAHRARNIPKYQR